jgi:hypothetical protein
LLFFSFFAFLFSSRSFLVNGFSFFGIYLPKNKICGHCFNNFRTVSKLLRDKSTNRARYGLRDNSERRK